MKLPVWIKPGVWGLVIGCVGTVAMGFGTMGWTTNSTAERVARTHASQAVAAAMVPFCVDKAKSDPDATHMVKFRAESSSYSRTQIVRSAGWATLGGATSPDGAVADSCAERLMTASG